MLEHQHAPQETKAPTHLPIEPHKAALLPPQAEAVLVGYLAQSQVEDAERETVRTHLEELTRAYLELDSTPHDAARSAIRQWEAEQQGVKERQVRSVQSKAQISARSARPATLTALKIFGGGAMVLIAMTPFFIGTTNPSLFALMMFMLFGLPALLGVAVGLRAQRRPSLGTFYAVSLLIPIVALVTELIMDLFTRFPHEGWWLGLDVGLFWLPIGCLTAGLTGWRRDLRHKRRRDAVSRIASTPQLVTAEPMP